MIHLVGFWVQTAGVFNQKHLFKHHKIASPCRTKECLGYWIWWQFQRCSFHIDLKHLKVLISGFKKIPKQLQPVHNMHKLGKLALTCQIFRKKQFELCESCRFYLVVYHIFAWSVLLWVLVLLNFCFKITEIVCWSGHVMRSRADWNYFRTLCKKCTP